jgi:ABC-type branched-subunit amino acid transport system ATPase component
VTATAEARPVGGHWSEGEAAAIEVIERLLPEQPDAGAALRAVGVDVRFGGVHALRAVTLDIPARGFVGLIGPNGSGKTTLFDVIGGFTRPGSGHIEAFGNDINRLRPWDRARLGISRTFQANHISLDLTVRDNLLAGAFMSVRGGVLRSVFGSPAVRADRATASELAGALERLLGLDDIAGVRAGALSFGAQRRTEIARCLMCRPRLLLLDEPSAGMDAHEAHQLVALIKRLQIDLGLTVCLIEHFVRMVFDTCDLIHVLARGDLIASGDAATVAGDEAVRTAYLGAPPIERADLEAVEVQAASDG